MTNNKPTRPAAHDICKDARRRTDALIEELKSHARKKRDNYANIAATCEHLLMMKPISEPTAENVAELGGNLFPYFPAQQTLNNDYRSLLNIWREAFNEIVRLKPRKVTTANLRIRDEDDFEREIGIFKAEIKLLKTELTHLRAILASQPTGPIEPHKAKPADALLLKAISNWLHEIKDLRQPLSPLEFTTAGIKVASRARPGMVIMKSEIVALIERSQ